MAKRTVLMAYNGFGLYPFLIGYVARVIGCKATEIENEILIKYYIK